MKDVNCMKVMHYYTYPENSGGPLSYIKNIISSEYFKSVEFGTCYQMKPFSALKLKDLKRIVNEIKAFSPDILHVHGLQSEGFIGLLAGKKAKVKKILMTVHGIQIDAQDIGFVKRAIFGKLIEPYTLKKSDAVYCVCKAMEKREFIQKHTRNLLPTLYNFIPDRFLNKTECDFPIPEHANKTVIVSVGRITLDKGMKELEYCVLNDNSDTTQYWIVGDGEYKEKMQQNLANQIKDKKVIFFGFQRNVKPFFEHADIFLFPTYHENLSISLLEAASQKCCPVVTDVGGNPEVVENGISGITFKAQSPDAALNALKKVVENPEDKEEYSKAIYKKVYEEFSESCFGGKLLKIYNDLIQG